MKVLSFIPDNLKEQLYKEILDDLKADNLDANSKVLLDDISKFIKDKEKVDDTKEVIANIVNKIMP